jgi:hypothetical protein
MDTKPQKRIKIDLTDVIAELETVHGYVRREFSGFGWGTWVQGAGGYNVFKIYRVEVLDVGTAVYTQIDPANIMHTLAYPDLKNMRVWFHAHPMGDARQLGPHNWSGMDDHTARFEPLGDTSGSAKWSISIVRTPTGWAGRYDGYGAHPETVHCEVFPNPLLDLSPALDGLLERAKGKYAFSRYSEIPVGDEQVNDEDELEFDDEEEADEANFFQTYFGGLFG